MSLTVSPDQPGNPSPAEPSATELGPSVDSEITWLLHRAAQRMRGAAGAQAEEPGVQLRDHICHWHVATVWTTRHSARP